MDESPPPPARLFPASTRLQSTFDTGIATPAGTLNAGPRPTTTLAPPRPAPMSLSALPLRTTLAALFSIPLAIGVALSAGGDDREDLFAQLREELPSPSTYRTASGAPGHEYWQQKVDYRIEVELDDEQQALRGSERIRYQQRNISYILL